MVTLEQIKLLESKIVRAIDVVNRLTEENIRLKKRNDELETRNIELEELAERLKDEKVRVEAGIVSALERLNQFEDVIERSLAVVKPASPQAAQTAYVTPGPAIPPAENAPFPPQPAVRPPEAPPVNAAMRPAEPSPGGLPSAYTVDEEEEEEPEELESAVPGEAELDIF